MIPRPNHGPSIFCQKSICILNKVLGQSITFILPSLPLWFPYSSPCITCQHQKLQAPFLSCFNQSIYLSIDLYISVHEALFHYILIVFNKLFIFQIFSI
jgi:hypothetical protein